MKNRLYKKFAGLVNARLNCAKNNNHEWFQMHTDNIKKLVRLLPHGSGFDNGTEIDLEKSTGEKLVFHTGYHHMNEDGFYDGWTYHTVTVRPSLQCGFVIDISGRDRNQIKEVIHDFFSMDLDQEVEG